MSIGGGLDLDESTGEIIGTVPAPTRLPGRSVGHTGRALAQLVAAACQVGGLGGVARQLDGFVVRRARLLTAAQPA